MTCFFHFAIISEILRMFFVMNSEKRNILNRASLFWLHSWIDQFQASSQVLPPNSPFPPFQIYIEMPNPTAAFDGQMTSPPPKIKTPLKNNDLKIVRKKPCCIGFWHHWWIFLWQPSYFNVKIYHARQV